MPESYPDHVIVALGEQPAQRTVNWWVRKDAARQFIVLDSRNMPINDEQTGHSFSNYLEPLYKKYKVDLVLQGHHYSFAIGRSAAGVGTSRHPGPGYFLSNCDPKMYDTNFPEWMERVATNVQMFHQIAIAHNALEVRSYLVNGELYDHVRLLKLSGRDQLFEEIEIKGVEERLDFPTNTLDADIDQSQGIQKAV